MKLDLLLSILYSSVENIDDRNIIHSALSVFKEMIPFEHDSTVLKIHIKLNFLEGKLKILRSKTGRKQVIV